MSLKETALSLCLMFACLFVLFPARVKAEDELPARTT